MFLPPNLEHFEFNKQNSLYVGYPRKKGGDIDFGQRLRSPFMISRKIAKSAPCRTVIPGII